MLSDSTVGGVVHLPPDFAVSLLQLTFAELFCGSRMSFILRILQYVIAPSLIPSLTTPYRWKPQSPKSYDETHGSAKHYPRISIPCASNKSQHLILTGPQLKAKHPAVRL